MGEFWWGFFDEWEGALVETIVIVILRGRHGQRYVFGLIRVTNL